jgi:hypothetical protein
MGKLTKRIRHRNGVTKKKDRKTGGCGCGMSGGKRNNRKSNKRTMKGGSTYLESLPIRYYYSLNEHNSSISDISSIGNSSKQFSGGKSKTIKHKSKSMRTNGGGIMNSIMNSPYFESVLNQPAGNLNNEHSPLMV